MGTNLLLPLASEIERLRRSLRPSAAGFRQIARTILIDAEDAAYPSDLLWLDAEEPGSRRDLLSRSLLAARAVAWMGAHFATVRADVEWLVVAALVADAGRMRLERPLLDAADPAHPSLSAALADGLTDAPVCLSRWVRNHHERLDGTGYPTGLGARGLAAEDRLLAVAARFAEAFAGSAAETARQVYDRARRGEFCAALAANLVWSVTGEMPAAAPFDRDPPESLPLTDLGRRRLRLDPAQRTLRGPHFSLAPSAAASQAVSARG